MTVQFIVTAHTARLAEAERLRDLLDARMFLDNGTLGEPGNTRAALKWAETCGADHALIIQDDALPVDRFAALAEQAIAERPEHIISYYLGTGRPAQDTVAKLVREADATSARWIDMPRLYWGVAWSIPIPRLPSLNRWLYHRTGPTDTETGHWAKYNRHPVTHTWPCLVDHADTDSLIHPRTEQRKAWRVATPATADR